MLAARAAGEVVLEAEGAQSSLKDNLLSRLSLNAEPCGAPVWRVRRLFARAEKEFDPALRAFGFYQAKVEKNLTTGGDCWQARFVVTLGAPVTIRKRDVVVLGDATGDKRLTELLASLPLPEGAVLNHAKYEEIKDQLRVFAAERGYLDFEFTRQQLRVYPDEAVAEIDIEAQSGPRYRFGELRFSKQALDEDFVRKLAKVPEGEPFHTRQLAAIDRRLSDGGYFSRVEVRPRRDEAVDQSVPIDIVLESADRHVWRAGAGYATDTGARVSFGYDNRYINPKGHRFSSNLRLSPVESSLIADYLVPGEDPHRENFSFGARLLHEDTDSRESDSASLIARQTIKTGTWTHTRFLELLHEKSLVGSDSTTATLLMPGYRLERTKADNVLQTAHGYRVSLEVRGSSESLLSTVTMLQLRGNAKGIHRFGEGGRVTGRVDIGSTIGESVTNLPASLRFFAGGDNSVRGYAYESLGPVDAAGLPEGGRNLLVGSIEYEHPVVEDEWWVAAFVDGGNAFSSEEFEPRYGYGIGIRWYSPVGRVRLDFAVPDDTDRDEWRLHFGLGADL